jgi:hypothetical protein
LEDFDPWARVDRSAGVEDSVNRGKAVARMLNSHPESAEKIMMAVMKERME